MRLSLRPLHLTSLLALTACLAAATSGCEINGDSGGGDIVVTPPSTNLEPSADPVSVTIDADATLDVKAGDGVGVFVEYATGGHWNVFTTCDYNTAANPGQACGFDIFATALDSGGGIDNPKGQDLSDRDSIAIEPGGTVHLYTENAVSLSGMTFDTAPGGAVELEVYLDGSADPHYIYWVGKDLLHNGAPTDPLDFKPSEVAVDSPPSGGTSGGVK
jgi:hypothetical protein